MTLLVIHSEFVVFAPIFAPASLKVTTTTAQLTFLNCKFDFTNAEIVISYTLKYALLDYVEVTSSKYSIRPTE